MGKQTPGDNQTGDDKQGLSVDDAVAPEKKNLEVEEQFGPEWLNVSIGRTLPTGVPVLHRPRSFSRSSGYSGLFVVRGMRMGLPTSSRSGLAIRSRLASKIS
jgi:hypothetical protein